MEASLLQINFSQKITPSARWCSKHTLLPSRYAYCNAYLHNQTITMYTLPHFCQCHALLCNNNLSCQSLFALTILRQGGDNNKTGLINHVINRPTASIWYVNLIIATNKGEPWHFLISKYGYYISHYDNDPMHTNSTTRNSPLPWHYSLVTYFVFNF